jgi:hypothetical protein
VREVGVQVEESAAPVGPGPLEASLDDTGPAALPPVFAASLEFAVAGTRVAGEFRCAECSYGAVVKRVLPQCPMCGGTVWESRGPFGSLRLVD